MVHHPLFCHVHIPKTGGTSLNALLNRWFPSAFQVIHHPDPHFAFQIDELAAQLSREPHLRCISTHHLRTFPSSIDDRPVYYFTMLREPLDRTISVITFMKKSFPEFSREHKASLPFNFERMPELDILKLWTPDSALDDPISVFPGNPVTAMFIGDRFQCDFLRHRRACEAAGAAKCIAILNRFLHVGDFACFEASVHELARRIRALGASTCETDHVPTERVSRDTRGNLKWLEEGRAVVNAYMEWQMIDGMVYRHFAQRQRQGAKT